MKHPHPQTASWRTLFPVPEQPHPGIESLLAKRFAQIWEESSAGLDDIPTFVGLSAVPPSYDHDRAEVCGNDYACALFGHFSGKIAVHLGAIPYPDENGEFVLKGHRYYDPLFLRNEYQLAKMIKRKMLPPSPPDGQWPSQALAWSKEKSLEVTEEERDMRETDHLCVVLIGDLLEMRLTRVLEWCLKSVAVSIKYDLPKDSENRDLKLKDTLKTHLGSCLKPVRPFLLQRVGRLIERGNPLTRLCQRRELNFYGPGGVHPESVGLLRLRDVNQEDLYRICPVQSPQGHTVGLHLYLARNANVDLQSRRILPPDNPQAGDSLGDAASLVPFTEHDDVARALMGANMMKQALPLESPQAPWIQTGWERELAKRPETDEVFKAEDTLALGANLLVGYLPWGLDTFEDGIVVSQSGAAALTSVEHKTFWLNVENTWDEGRRKKTEVTRDNPAYQDDERILGKLDEHGIIKVDEEVGPGDVLVSALLSRSRRINKTKVIDQLMNRLAEDIFGETESLNRSLKVPPSFRGEVVEIIDLIKPSRRHNPFPRGVKRRIGVRIKREEHLVVGDKLTGRHGNKGVVVRILPDREMPYFKVQNNKCGDEACCIVGPHRHLQMIINPLGVTGRLNVGQLYETALARVAEKRGEPYVVRPFADTWNPERLSDALQGHGFKTDGKEQLYVFEDGAETPLRHRSLVGPQYIIRLHHLAWEKAHGRGAGRPMDYTVRDDQPKRGKLHHGGQRVGEMETWALAGHGAWHLLDDFLTVKSDDLSLRKSFDGRPMKWDGKRRPMALVNLALAVRGLGLDLKFLDADRKDVTDKLLQHHRGATWFRMTLDITTSQRMEVWGLRGEIQSPELYAKAGSLWPHPEGLYSRMIFERSWHIGRITLAEPLVHPLAAKGLWEVFYFPKKFKDAAWNWGTVLFDLIQDEDHWPELKKPETPDRGFALHLWRVTQIRNGLIGKNRRPKDYLLSTLPVIPTRFRMERLGRVQKFKHPLNRMYSNVIVANTNLKRLIEKKAPEQILQHGRERLFRAVQSLFLGDKQQIGLVGILKGKKGLMRGHLAGKRVDFSGRAVIVGDPSVALDEIRLPKTLWHSLFPDQKETDKGERIVLLNRQPSLHRYSFLAFEASPHDEGDVIRMNPFVCKPFNADFDGDTMAVHIPKKPQARSEAHKLLPSNNLISQANGELVLGFGGDLAIGALYLSHHPGIQSEDEVPLTGEKHLPLEGRCYQEKETIDGIQTTVGRLLLRRVFQDVPIPNHSFDDRRWKDVLKKACGKTQDVKRFTDKLSQLLTMALRGSGFSLSVSDFASSLDVEENKTSPNFLWLLRNAGAKGDLKHLIGPRGTMRRPGVDTQSSTITSGLIQGHTEDEYLLSAHGARAGLCDKGLNTAPAGILLRDLIYKLQSIYIVTEDCKKKDDSRAAYLCPGRDGEGRRGICQKCYGPDPATGQPPEIGLPVGVLAAQAIGERASQLTLRTFHTGGGTKEETLNLKNLREWILHPKVKTDEAASQWLNRIMDKFEQHPDPPRQVHFEVILRGMTEESDREHFLAEVTKSKVALNLLEGAARYAEDDLQGVISRIVSGRLIGTGPRKEVKQKKGVSH